MISDEAFTVSFQKPRGLRQVRRTQQTNQTQAVNFDRPTTLGARQARNDPGECVIAIWERENRDNQNNRGDNPKDLGQRLVAYSG